MFLLKKFSSSALVFGISSSLVCQGLSDEGKVKDDCCAVAEEDNSFLGTQGKDNTAELETKENLGQDFRVGFESPQFVPTLLGNIQELADKDKKCLLSWDNPNEEKLGTLSSNVSSLMLGKKKGFGNDTDSKLTGINNSPTDKEIEYEDVFHGENSDFFLRWLCNTEKVKGTWFAKFYHGLFHTYEGDSWRKPKKLLAFALWLFTYVIVPVFSILFSYSIISLSVIYGCTLKGLLVCCPVVVYAIFSFYSPLCASCFGMVFYLCSLLLANRRKQSPSVVSEQDSDTAENSDTAEYDDVTQNRTVA